MNKMLRRLTERPILNYREVSTLHLVCSRLVETFTASRPDTPETPPTSLYMCTRYGL